MFADKLPSWVNTTSARVGAGLGTIARVVASGEAIYRDKLSFADAERRVTTCWQPFHDALGGLIAETHAAFGYLPADRLPLDAVAGPCRAVRRQAGRFRAGRCPWHRLRAAGNPPGRDDRWLTWATRCGATTPMPAATSPAITAGRAKGVHALQIEIARELYMDEGRIERLPGFAAVQQSHDPLRRRPGREVRWPERRLILPACHHRAKKWRRLVAPPSLGRKRPRKQTARSGTALLRCTI